MVDTAQLIMNHDYGRETKISRHVGYENILGKRYE